MMTKEKWEELSPKARWDVLVALRGPDCVHSDRVKWFTASVIRAEMQKVIRVGGLVNNTKPGFIIVGGGYLDKEFNPEHPQLLWDYHHYFSHQEEAANILGLHTFSVPLKEYLSILNLHGSTGALKEFWKYLQKKYEIDKESDTAKMFLNNIKLHDTGMGGF